MRENKTTLIQALLKREKKALQLKKNRSNKTGTPLKRKRNRLKYLDLLCSESDRPRHRLAAVALSSVPRVDLREYLYFSFNVKPKLTRKKHSAI